MTAADLLAPIREREQAATSLGEWETTRANDVVIYAPNGFGAYHLVAHADSREDAEFIAAARTDVPRLLAALDAVLAVDPFRHPDNPWTDGYNDALEEVRAAVTKALQEGEK